MCGKGPGVWWLGGGQGGGWVAHQVSNINVPIKHSIPDSESGVRGFRDIRAELIDVDYAQRSK